MASGKIPSISLIGLIFATLAGPPIIAFYAWIVPGTLSNWMVVRRELLILLAAAGLILLILNARIFLNPPNEARATAVLFWDSVNFIIHLCSKYSG